MSLHSPPDFRDRDAFLAALAEGLPEDERMILCGFPGAPDMVGAGAWRPRPWAPGRDVPLEDNSNAYVTVSSFLRSGDGSFRRRSESFAAGRALMVDDVGTKVPIGVVSGVPATAIVETSPGNFQHWYFLRRAEEDQARFDALIRAFISGKLLGADPGMAGVTRVGRVPGYRNNKPQHCGEDRRGFRVRLVALDAERRWSIDDLVEAFELKLNGRREPREKLVTEAALERNRAFTPVYRFLADAGQLKRAGPDPSGWTEMSCPWRDAHSGGADTGAAIREPAAENDYYGAFRCHHGHCADRGWAELTEWVGERAAEILDAAAAREHETKKGKAK